MYHEPEGNDKASFSSPLLRPLGAAGLGLPPREQPSAGQEEAKEPSEPVYTPNEPDDEPAREPERRSRRTRLVEREERSAPEADESKSAPKAAPVYAPQGMPPFLPVYPQGSLPQAGASPALPMITIPGVGPCVWIPFCPYQGYGLSAQPCPPQAFYPAAPVQPQSAPAVSAQAPVPVKMPSAQPQAAAPVLMSPAASLGERAKQPDAPDSQAADWDADELPAEPGSPAGRGDAVPTEKMADPMPVSFSTLDFSQKKRRKWPLVLLCILCLLAAACAVLWQTGTLQELIDRLPRAIQAVVFHEADPTSVLEALPTPSPDAGADMTTAPETVAPPTEAPETAAPPTDAPETTAAPTPAPTPTIVPPTATPRENQSVMSSAQSTALPASAVQPAPTSTVTPLRISAPATTSAEPAPTSVAAPVAPVAPPETKTVAPAANDAAQSSIVTEFSVDKPAAVTPATLTFTILSAPDVEKVRLLDEQGAPFSMGILFTREDGYIKWSCMVKFTEPYEGKVRAYVLAADGFWADSGYEVDVSVNAPVL